MRTALLLMLGLTTLARGDDFTDELERLKKGKDSTATAAFIEASREKQKDNPDYYAKSSNYWWSRSSEPVISTKPAGEGEFDLIDEKTGKKAGSLGSGTNPEFQKKALAFVTEGYRKFPERLDIGFGLSWVQFQMGKQEEAVATIKSILKTAKEKPDQLKWTLNGPLPRPAATFIPESIQGYTAPLFREETPRTDALLRELCTATIGTYPDHPFAYNLLAALADANHDQPETLRLLKLAHEKAPADPLVLGNVADAHRRAKQPDEALAAYRKLLKLDIDEETKAEVEKNIAALTKDAKTAPAKNR